MAKARLRDFHILGPFCASGDVTQPTIHHNRAQRFGWRFLQMFDAKLKAQFQLYLMGKAA